MGAPGLTRQLTLAPAVGLIVGQVIAVGIFLTPGAMLRTLASPALVLAVWMAIGAMAICGALCYGALAARFPAAGGGYVYLREAYGRRVAFLYGWKCLLIMDPGITAALAAGAAAYVSYVIPLSPWSIRAVAIAAILLFAIIHIIGVGPGTRVLTALAVLKIALIGGLVVLALASGAEGWQHFVPFAARRSGAPPLGGAIAGGLVAAFFSFGGWWEVTKIAGEVRDPRRTLPRALWLGLTAVTIIYLAATLAFIYAIPIERIAAGDAFVAQVGAALLGSAGGTAVALAIIVCVLGSLGATLMFAPRLYVAMAEDGVFPAAAGAIHPRFGTPARAIAVQAALASLFVVLGTFDTIVAYFVFITVVFVALTVASVFAIRRREPGFSVPGHPWPALAFLVMVCALLILLAVNNPLQAGLGVAVVAAGVPAYRVVTRATAATRSKESG
ncbi:MAG: amino acid permease [Acidobacteriota bacterium]